MIYNRQTIRLIARTSVSLQAGKALSDEMNCPNEASYDQIANLIMDLHKSILGSQIDYGRSQGWMSAGYIII